MRMVRCSCGLATLVINLGVGKLDFKQCNCSFCVQIQDGPDENGEMFMRPGKLSDYFPRYSKSALVFTILFSVTGQCTSCRIRVTYNLQTMDLN
jgi:hypothetical protein